MPFDFATSEDVVPSPTTAWTAERFVAALHPQEAHGRVSVMMADSDHMHTRTYRPGELEAVVGVLAETESYVAMNRFHGPRGRSRLAALNAVWLDLDVYRVPELAHRPRPEIAALIRDRAAAAGLPPASLLIDSGRGFYVVWLLDGAAPAARPRWTALIRALVSWAGPLGADPACVDVARVLRLPGSWHAAANRQVAVLEGDAKRYAFERFAAAVWQATGRPDRPELAARKAACASCPRRTRGAPTLAAPRGLSRQAFWRVALDDLERLRIAWGGVVPAGRRVVWLHLHTTALGWTSVEPELADRVVEAARVAAPELSVREVRRTMAPTIRRVQTAAAGRGGANGRDPRYDYGGARMADLLGVDRALAEAHGLRQIVPGELRADRARDGRIARRRAVGVAPRAIWLAAHPVEREQPWRSGGISRATWYRRLKAARALRRRAGRLRLLTGVASGSSNSCETGPDSLYGGKAQPSACARRPEALRPAEPLKTPTSPLTAPSDQTLPTKNAPMLAEVHSGLSALVEKVPLPAKASSGSTREETSMPFIDPDVLAQAARRLTTPDLGVLTRVALELTRGPAARHELGSRLKLGYEEFERVEHWLRLRSDGRTVIGLTEPPAATSATVRRQRQGMLFDDPAFLPSSLPKPCDQPSGIKTAVFDEALRILGKSGVSNNAARGFLAGLLKDHGLGLVAEAINDLSRSDAVVDPRAWLKAYVAKRQPAQTKFTKGSPTPGGASAVAPAARPLATPDFLGVSPQKAEKIREQTAI